MNTRSGNKKDVDKELRAAQTIMRLTKIEEAYHVVQLMTIDEEKNVAQMNLREKGAVRASSRELDEVN